MKGGNRLALLVIVASVALAVGLSIQNGFVYDDVPSIVQNPRVTDPSRWSSIPTSTYWLGTLWRPLTVAGFAAQWWLGHGAPWLFHLVSLLMYVAVGWLVFRMLEEFGTQQPVALGVSALFLVHPVHVEVVANVVGQGELWTTLSLVASTLLYLRIRRNGFHLPALVALLAVIAAGAMAKEQGFTAPLLLVGVEWLLLRDRQEERGARWRVLLPVFLFTAMLLLLRSTITGTIKGEQTAASLLGLGFVDRVVTFVGLVPEYFRLLVWPLHLQAEYSPPAIPVGGPLALRHLFGMVILATMVLLFVRTRRRAPVAAFGIWWAAVSLGPVSHLLAPAGLVMAERVFFLPSLGVAIALAAGLAMLAERATNNQRAIVMAMLACWGVAATIRSAVRVGVWREERAFFTQLPVDAAGDYRAAMVAGVFWRDQQEPALAEAQFRRALTLWPHDPHVHEDLGQLLREHGRCPEAIPIMTSGLTLQPDRVVLRAKLFGCVLTTGDTVRAIRIAREGEALGDSGFASLRRRLEGGSSRP